MRHGLVTQIIGPRFVPIAHHVGHSVSSEPYSNFLRVANFQLRNCYINKRVKLVQVKFNIFLIYHSLSQFITILCEMACSPIVGSSVGLS